MALIPCSECGAQVSDRAPSCPRCGAPIAQPPKKRGGVGCLSALAVLVVIGMVGSLIEDAGGGKTKAKRPWEASRSMAYLTCKDAVTTMLKAPSTADFASVYDARTDSSRSSNGEVVFVFTGWVDAENSFGAKLRNQFVCEAKVPANSDRYRAQVLTFR